jgi:hypothetical protein
MIKSTEKLNLENQKCGKSLCLWVFCVLMSYYLKFVGFAVVVLALLAFLTQSFTIQLHLEDHKPWCGTICRCSPRDPPSCETVFTGYESSSFEKEWLGKVKQLEHHTDMRVCAEVAKEKRRFMQMYKLTTRIEEKLLSGRGASNLNLLPSDIFSTLRYRVKCKNLLDPRNGIEISVPIEPLVGVLRDARGVCSELEPRDIGSRSMILLAPASEFGEDRIRILDIGSSSWDAGKGSTSQNWLVKSLAGKNAAGFCLLSFHGFEAEEKYVFSSFASKLPPELVPVYTNFLVKASPEKGNALNPWSIVRSLKDGIFAVKLDIDTPAVEMPLVDQLLEDKEIQSRVQEFFFEHHTKIAEMVPSWGNKTQGLLSDTYDMFLRLRKAGVRAHAWP